MPYVIHAARITHECKIQKLSIFVPTSSFLLKERNVSYDKYWQRDSNSYGVFSPMDFKSIASTNSAMPARCAFLHIFKNLYHERILFVRCSKISQAGVIGFEPMNAGIKILCLTAWQYPIGFPQWPFITLWQFERFLFLFHKNFKCSHSLLTFFTQKHISFQFMSYLITVLCLGLLQNLVLRFLLFYVHLRLLFQFYNLLTTQAERQVLKLKDGWWIRTTFIRFIASNVHLLNNFTYNHSVPTHTRICHAQQISFRCCHPPYFYLQLFCL